MLIRTLPDTIPAEVLTATKGSSSAKPKMPRMDSSMGLRGWLGARGRGGGGGLLLAGLVRRPLLLVRGCRAGVERAPVRRVCSLLLTLHGET